MPILDLSELLDPEIFREVARVHTLIRLGVDDVQGLTASPADHSPSLSEKTAQGDKE